MAYNGQKHKKSKIRNTVLWTYIENTLQGRFISSKKLNRWGNFIWNVHGIGIIGPPVMWVFWRPFSVQLPNKCWKIVAEIYNAVRLVFYDCDWKDRRTYHKGTYSVPCPTSFFGEYWAYAVRSQWVVSSFGENRQNFNSKNYCITRQVKC